MMFDYLNQRKLTIPTTNLEEEDIAEIMQTDMTGTQFYNVEYINRLTSSSNPSLEFVPEYEDHTLADIRKEIEEGLPVTVWIVTNDGSGDFAHAVVITGIDDFKKEISYNDPTYGVEKTISQSRFLDIWEFWGAIMIKAKIGRVTTQPLEKYSAHEGK